MIAIEMVEEACWRAFRLGFKFSRNFSLKVEDGHYMPLDNSTPICHPLEAVLLGESKNETALTDVVDLLQVDVAWSTGFLLGYENLPEVELPDLRYAKGYKVGQKIRSSYPPEENEGEKN